MKMLNRIFLFVAALGLVGTVQAAPVDGKVQWLRRVELSTPVSGVISRVHVQPGDTVKKGQALLELDQRVLKAELQRAEAVLEGARQAAAEAQRELERTQELYDRTLLSQHDLDVARIEATAAQARVESAQAALASARLNLEYSIVRTPFNGIVLARPGEIGQTVVSELEAVPLVVVAATDNMVARVPVGEEAVRSLREGTEVAVRVDGARYTGRIGHLGLEPLDAGAAPVQYPVDVVFAPDRQLRAGQKATVELP